MSTYLQLCQDLVRECGISTSSSGPSAVTSQSGEMLRVVNWIKKAYDEILVLHPNWKFLRSSFTVSTSSGDNVYLPADCTDSRLSAAMTADKFQYWWTDTFRIYLSSAGVSTQAYLPHRQYDSFRDYWLLGSPANARPSEFTVRPDDNAIMPGATPDDTYVITGDYQRMGAPLAADADEPLIPTRFQQVIVYRAGMKYARYEEDGGLYQGMQLEHDRIMADLEANQLPPIQQAPALA